MEEATSHKQGGDSASTSPVFKGDDSGQYFSPQQDIIILSSSRSRLSISSHLCFPPWPTLSPSPPSLTRHILHSNLGPSPFLVSTATLSSGTDCLPVNHLTPKGMASFNKAEGLLALFIAEPHPQPQPPASLFIC